MRKHMRGLVNLSIITILLSNNPAFAQGVDTGMVRNMYDIFYKSTGNQGVYRSAIEAFKGKCNNSVCIYSWILSFSIEIDSGIRLDSLYGICVMYENVTKDSVVIMGLDNMDLKISLHEKRSDTVIERKVMFIGFFSGEIFSDRVREVLYLGKNNNLDGEIVLLCPSGKYVRCESKYPSFTRITYSKRNKGEMQHLKPIRVDTAVVYENVYYLIHTRIDKSTLCNGKTDIYILRAPIRLNFAYMDISKMDSVPVLGIKNIYLADDRLYRRIWRKR